MYIQYTYYIGTNILLEIIEKLMGYSIFNVTLTIYHEYLYLFLVNLYLSVLQL